MAELSHSFAVLAPGDPAPWFQQRSWGNLHYSFDTAAGRYIVLCFFLAMRDEGAARALGSVAAHRSLFDDENISFFGVTTDEADERDGRLKDALPGIRFFLDFDGKISRLYGVIPKDTKPDERNVPVRRFWIVLDPTLRVTKVFFFEKEGGEQAALFEYLKSLPPPDRFAGFPLQAPILMIPNVFEPEFCKRLIALYESNGGKEFGFMRDVGGRTVPIFDHAHKRRRDYMIEAEDIIRETQWRIRRRIAPEIQKAYQFKVTRMERCIVSCYSADETGHFQPHRDDTTRGTAHRRFAVSINLNDDFEGGEIAFPEYSWKGFKMPVGMAGVFSCSLLHMVSVVTRGRRYAFLPFLYDDEAARIRLANNRYLGAEMSPYLDTEIEKLDAAKA